MPATAQSEAFSRLVDHMRGQKGKESVDLVDILTLAEVMVGAMQSFFSSVDAKVYAEFRGIADFIERTKTEVAALQPNDLQQTRIPRAGKELDAIVKQTEDATNTIMESAERIMNADPSDHDAYHATVQDAVMQIFEACSFQDITGQRISKVVATLKHIEERVTRISNAFGVADAPEPEENEDEKRRADLLLNGPQLDGEGVDQSDVDAFFEQAAGKEASQNAIDALFD
ncbi:MAG: protein phosphatase CheZ [Alphaproteobacteria bacterium]